jgi:hypothetical protein
MKNISMILFAASICVSGCTSGYRVHVNGFSETDLQIKQKSSVYVSVDPNSENPIFDKEIKAKIEELLKWYEYAPAEDLEQSDYRLTFHASMDSHQTSGFTSLYHPYVGFHGEYWSGYHFGYSTYVPYYDTYYDQRLGIKVYARDPDNDSTDEKIVWVGEAMISTSGEDFRRTINYLLVGCFQYFGADTSRQRSLIVTEKDPRIIKIESPR